MKNYIHTIIMNITVYKILIKAIIYHISFLASTYHYFLGTHNVFGHP